MRKLVFADVDGTMVRTGSEQYEEDYVSPHMHAVVRRMLDNEVVLPVNTSRTSGMMAELATSLGLRDLSVLDGGATIYDFGRQARDERLSRWLAISVTKEVVQKIGPHIGTIFYTEHSQERTSETFDISEIVAPTPSVFASYDNRRAARIETLLSPISGIDAHINTYNGTTTHTCVQVVTEGVSKKSGIEIVLGDECYADIRAEDMVAIGDGKPDVDMFHAMPPGALKLAMGNAHPELKAEADIVLPYTADEDGFAWAMEQYVLR